MFDPGEAPQSWFVDGLLDRPLFLATSVIGALTLHACLDLVAKDPGLTGQMAGILHGFMGAMEAKFEAMGLEPPPGGWRRARDFEEGRW